MLDTNVSFLNMVHYHDREPWLKVLMISLVISMFDGYTKAASKQTLFSKQFDERVRSDFASVTHHQLDEDSVLECSIR